MDIELILYIVFVVIALLIRVLKGKKENAPPPPQQSSNNSGERPQKTLTFEELLREFTGDEAQREQRPQETYADHDEYEDEEEYVDDDEVKETYERSVRQAKELKTLDEQVDLKKPITTAHHFKGYEQEEENTLASDILETLKDADGAKKAIILSEIINRKY